MNEIKDKIKLVIWDLDETFWEGTLSEEGIKYNEIHHNIVIELARKGIVSSICSKNTFEDVELLLTKKGIWNYFVFPEIDWLPKGQLVKKIISDMGLRADNVLFIDDNLGNLKEVEFFNKNISVCEPSIIASLLSSEFLKGKNDLTLSRLEQYKVLENKRNVMSATGVSNTEFLKSSMIEVSINKDILNKIDRVHELVERTNQLNYTKIRASKEDLIKEIKSPNVEAGYISVNDKFGSYGISGFYLVRDNRLVHFLFSCRTMNMGIESWLYNMIGNPVLNVVGSVAINLEPEKDYSYIKKVTNIVENNQEPKNGNDTKKLLLIGGCDIDQAVHYLPYSNINTDFNYVNKLGLNVHKEHSELLRQFCFENNNYDDVIDPLPILDRSDKDYKLLNYPWDVLVFSPLNDYSRGLYKHNETGFVLPFDSFNINWCDESNWKNIPVHLSNIPESFLLNLRENYTFIGAISPAKFKVNLKSLIQKFPERKIILLTGSEVELKETPCWEKGMQIRHVEMNEALFELKESFDVDIIDVRHFVKDQSSHLDNIRHYKKSAYLQIAKEITNLFNLESGQNSKINNGTITNIKLFTKRIADAVIRRIKLK